MPGSKLAVHEQGVNQSRCRESALTLTKLLVTGMSRTHKIAGTATLLACTPSLGTSISMNLISSVPNYRKIIVLKTSAAHLMSKECTGKRYILTL